MNLNRALSLVKLIVLIVVCLTCVAIYPYLNAADLSAFIAGNRITAPLAFIVVCALRPVLFFLPSMGLTIVAGTLFGVLWGTVYVAVGGAFSTAVGFYFARWLGREWMERLTETSQVIRNLDRWSKQYGKKAVWLMRLFNLPWDVVSYWAGLTGIPFRDFYVASLVLLVPMSFLYTYFGARIMTPHSLGFVLSLIVILLMGSLPYLMKRRKNKNG